LTLRVYKMVELRETHYITMISVVQVEHLAQIQQWFSCVCMTRGLNVYNNCISSANDY